MCNIQCTSMYKCKLSMYNKQSTIYKCKISRCNEQSKIYKCKNRMSNIIIINNKSFISDNSPYGYKKKYI